jgi:hypothetical protein
MERVRRSDARWRWARFLFFPTAMASLLAQSFSPNLARDGRQTCRPASTNSVRAGRQGCCPSCAELGLKDWATLLDRRQFCRCD